MVGIVHFYDLAFLDETKTHSIVLSGWAFAGWNNKNPYKINIAIIDQSPNGKLRISTGSYVDSPTINGSGSVIAHDFNSDGIEDIFLAAHNESPLVSTASTAYLSQADGKFRKITLNDSSQAHSAILSDLQGAPTIVTSGYGGEDAYYQYSPDSDDFEVRFWGNIFSKSIYGSTALTADLDGDGTTELVIGDFKTGPGVDFSNRRPADIAIYRVENGRLYDRPEILLNPYFNQTKYLNIGLDSAFGASLSHTYRVWAHDFNYDGKEDLLFGVGVWSSSSGWTRAKLQMFQNNGALSFTDVTDRLGTAYDEQSSYVDYSMQMLDLDQSGIKSFLLAGDPNAGRKQQSNYLLVNDGTGRLHEALHDDFFKWSKGQAGKFIPYQRADGLLNYLFIDQRANLSNFDIRYNITTDFKESITVSDRNHSELIRTFAGNDIIFDTGRSSKTTRIDGGLGYDTSTYSMAESEYSVIANPDASISVSSKNGYTDILKNIEAIKFADNELRFPIIGSPSADELSGGENDDFLNGLGGPDRLIGGLGNDTLVGGTGDDYLDGGGGLDTIDFSGMGGGIVVNLAKGLSLSSFDNPSTNAGTDQIKDIESVSGTPFSDQITGNISGNLIVANEGDDTIDGGLGADTLTGGAGIDRFVFSTKPAASNVDTLTDFVSGTDKIVLSVRVFAKLKGLTDLSAHLANGAAADANDFLLFDRATGRLSYDADGNGRGLAVEVAVVGNAQLQATDIAVG